MAAMFACTPRLALRSDLSIVARAPGYTIASDGGSEFFILADTIAYAETVAKEVLDCAHRVCVLAPEGVILRVERFDK